MEKMFFRRIHKNEETKLCSIHPCLLGMLPPWNFCSLKSKIATFFLTWVWPPTHFSTLRFWFRWVGFPSKESWVQLIVDKQETRPTASLRDRSLWIDKLGIWICDKLLVLLVYPVLILTSNNHQPHWLKDWKPKRGKCKQIIKSVPLNRQMECLTTWWTNSVCLWSEILFLLMWGSVDILCQIEEKNCLFFTYIDLPWPITLSLILTFCLYGGAHL